MNKTVFMRLWDLYNGLLTQTQQEITHLYFNLDLTVSEIAEEKGISRQAVSECLKTCEKQLEEYESKLKFASRINNISKWTEKFVFSHPEFSEEAKALSELLYNN